MKKRKNEIIVKISVTDDMLSAITNAIIAANVTMPPQALMAMKSTAALPPSSPLGFRAKGRR